MGFSIRGAKVVNYLKRITRIGKSVGAKSKILKNSSFQEQIYTHLSLLTQNLTVFKEI